jgi:hypothetical protein
MPPIGLRWVKAGLAGALTGALLRLIFDVVDGYRYLGDTIWFWSLHFLNLPAGLVHNWILRALNTPRIYDGSLEWDEALIMGTSYWTLTLGWWFILGVAASYLWRRFERLRARDR